MIMDRLNELRKDIETGPEMSSQKLKERVILVTKDNIEFQNKIKELSESVSIVDFVCSKLDVRKKGPYVICKCIACDADSFTVSDHRNSFYCFNCSIAGDIVTFACMFHKVKKSQAIDLIGSRQELVLERKTNDE